jgi:hypothetical protein
MEVRLSCCDSVVELETVQPIDETYTKYECPLCNYHISFAEIEEEVCSNKLSNN